MLRRSSQHPNINSCFTNEYVDENEYDNEYGSTQTEYEYGGENEYEIEVGIRHTKYGWIDVFR